MDIEEGRCEDVDWTHLAQNMLFLTRQYNFEFHRKSSEIS
jgi:hypothetical protein